MTLTGVQKFQLKMKYLVFFLGIKIVGGKSSLGTDYGIFVKKILAGGVAEVDGKLELKTIRLQTAL